MDSILSLCVILKLELFKPVVILTMIQLLCCNYPSSAIPSRLFSSSSSSSSDIFLSILVLSSLMHRILSSRPSSLKFTLGFMNSAMHLFSTDLGIIMVRIRRFLCTNGNLHVVLLDGLHLCRTLQVGLEQDLHPLVKLGLDIHKAEQSINLGILPLVLSVFGFEQAVL